MDFTERISPNSAVKLGVNHKNVGLENTVCIDIAIKLRDLKNCEN